MKEFSLSPEIFFPKKSISSQGNEREGEWKKEGRGWIEGKRNRDRG